jgi:hypothetical protein
MPLYKYKKKTALWHLQSDTLLKFQICRHFWHAAPIKCPHFRNAKSAGIFNMRHQSNAGILEMPQF